MFGTRTDRQNGRSSGSTLSGNSMNFRLVWVGSDDDSAGRPAVNDGAGALLRQDCGAAGYEIRGTEMVRCAECADGRRKLTTVANFIARIVRDVVLDDGAESRRELVVEVDLTGHRLTLQMQAVEFARMGWVLNRLGPQAILYPGQQQHARAAIQWLSGAIRHEHIFTHMGWRRHASEWVYLQGGGALGARGLRGDVQVRLPSGLERYKLPAVADAGGQISAIRASLQFLSVAPDRISLPLLAAVYRAPLGKVDFSLFLTGPSGAFKTALAALCQQHFGAEMDAGGLPAHFGSTGNALEELAFRAKDALLVVDDFVPAERLSDSQLRQTAEQLFRGAGNRQGRGRLEAHGRLRAPRACRALLLATGEDVPRGRSLRARLLIVELRPGEVDRSLLSALQTAGCRGDLAGATAGFVSWIAERYEQVQQLLLTGVRSLRGRALATASHARLPTTLAELQTGWEIWLEFAREAGAIGEEEQIGLAFRGSQALAELVPLQASYQLADGTAQGVEPPASQLSRETMATAEPTKKARVIAMLDSASGATLGELMAATGWQKHTVSGFISGTAVRQMGLKVSSFRRDGGRVYRIDP